MTKKLTLSIFNNSDSKTLKEEYTDEDIIRVADDMLESYIGLLSSRLNDLGISMWTTGSIRKEFYNGHISMGDSKGLKVYID